MNHVTGLALKNITKVIQHIMLSYRRRDCERVFTSQWPASLDRWGTDDYEIYNEESFNLQTKHNSDIKIYKEL